MKNRSHRFDINEHRLRHGHKYTKFKMTQKCDIRKLYNTNAESNKITVMKGMY